jgi:hypothetical protein
LRLGQWLGGRCGGGTGDRLLDGAGNVDVTDTDTDLTFQGYPGVGTNTISSSTDGANTADTDFTGELITPAVDVENVNKAQVALVWADDSSTLSYVTLPDAQEGTEVLLYCVSQVQASDTVAFVGSFGGVNNIATLGAAGDYSALRFMEGAWRVIYDDGTNGVTLSASTALAL